MSTVVCQQGVHPCKESCHVVESTTMRLRLVAPNEITKEKSHDDGFGGWSFLQSLSSEKPIQEFREESTYVHPLVKQSSLWKLSEKSLELCTESLGSETGSDTCHDSIFSFPESPLCDKENEEKSVFKEERNLVPPTESKRVVSRSFPPPLTTISGSNSLQVRPHREGGRLIIQAMEAPLSTSCFQAERSHGRLLLTCWKSEDSKFDSENEENEVLDVENEKTYKGEDEEEEDMERIRVEMGIEKFQRPSRCKEDGHGDKGLYKKWEPFWVATS